MTKNSKAQAKQIVLEIIQQAGGHSAASPKTHLAFYAAHLFYFQENPGFLSDWPIVKLPNGPAIYRLDLLISELLASGFLTTSPLVIGPYSAASYQAADKKNAQMLPAPELTAIAKAVGFLHSRPEPEIVLIVQQLSRSWAMAQKWEPLDIYVDVIPEDEYQERERAIKALRGVVANAVLENELCELEDVPSADDEVRVPADLHTTWADVSAHRSASKAS